MPTRKKHPSKGRRGAKRPTVGQSIIEGLRQAIEWTRGENDDVRVRLVPARPAPRSQTPDDSFGSDSTPS